MELFVNYIVRSIILSKLKVLHLTVIGHLDWVTSNMKECLKALQDANIE